MKKICFLFVLLFLISPLFSLSKKFKYNDFSLTAFYKSELKPGDALFVRLVFECKNKKLIKSLGSTDKEKGNLALYRLLEQDTVAEKASTKSQFYEIERKATKKLIKSVLLTGAPLSTFAKAGDYVTKISFSAFGNEDSVELPLKIVEKEFVSETIPLNESNTAIKTNVSKERSDQIKRLNAILDTRDFAAVYETKAFAPPTPALRRTSFFGDRRVFAYSDGKSSTSLHYGIDYGIPTGNEVRSCGRGKVLMAENRISTGWSVCVEHLPGLYSLYYHMSELKVEVGQMVDKGDLLGLSGATGLATGPHLHWEVRLNMEAISPDFMLEDFSFSSEK